MAAVQPIPADEIDAELAGSWDPEDGPAVVVGTRTDSGAGAGPRAGSDAPARPWRPSGPEDVAQALARTRPVSLRVEQGLPVTGALTDLLPAGLPRGAVIGVGNGEQTAMGSEPVAGATSLALTLAAAPSAAGSWVALVGLPAVGLVAAAELGISLERVVVVSTPPPDRWATVVGALVGAFDVVLVDPPPRVRAAEARRLAARARERGSVLVALGPRAGSEGRVGSDGSADPVLSATVRLRVVAQRWFGVGEGHGHLQRRLVRIELDGRRQAARSRQADLWLPDETGQVREVRPDEAVGLEPVTAGSVITVGSAGSVGSVGSVTEVRRQRIRRVARRPLPASPTVEPDSWSDAG